MDSNQPQPNSKNKAVGIAACIAAACAVAVPIAQRWEGYAPKVYRDPANIPTYCYGETQNISKDPTRIYAKTECAALLRQREARDYAPRILQCIPQLNDMNRTKVFGALIDASYNAGWQGVCQSPMRAYIIAGNWKSACNSLLTYYITARYRGTPKPASVMIKQGWHWDSKVKAWRKLLPGLVNRRKDEAKTCLLNA